ncbi:class I SAM-dependent DNA methyltransferase [Pseudalkalibacillus sp. Hm43]|uniref:class I SAM-dependent DNA methyltransferase n=1 Tax=Pseudalkalibacillus sp. Hm43 TaxID=3450742 RepID=UPI003F43C140
MNGSTFYENEQFFNQFQKRRNRSESPNNVLEGPAINDLIGSPKGDRILDLGCGDGLFGKELLERGAVHYHGIDGSERMVELARKGFEDTRVEFQCRSLEGLKLQQNHYDLVVSRLVFHYLKDVQPVFEKVFHSLTHGGRFVFSVQHPVITASMKSASGGKRENWIVDDYFKIGERTEPWMDQMVTKYHRTTEQYITEILQAGFQLEGLKEGTPDERFFSQTEEYERRSRIPVVLILSARKP